MSSARRSFWDAGVWVGALLALAAIVMAAKSGAAPDRVGPTAGFALLWFAAASYVLFAGWATRRRATGLRTASVPHGVRLVRPLWIPLQETSQVIAVAAALGAGAAWAGFPWVAVGIVLALAAFGMFMTAMTGGVGLTFEPAGLRIHLRSGHCLVPWTAIVDFSATAATRSRVACVNVEVADPGAVYASLSPDTKKARTALWAMFAIGTPAGRGLWFGEWTGGLDAETLARAIREGMGRFPPSQVS